MSRWTTELFGATVALLLLASLPCHADEPAALVGDWAVISMEADGNEKDEMNFAGMRWVFDVKPGVLTVHAGTRTPAGIASRPPLKCSYTLDDAPSPRHFNWTMGDGDRKRTVHAIYALKEDVLSISFVKGGKQRPTGFDTQGTKSVLYRLKKRNDD